MITVTKEKFWKYFEDKKYIIRQSDCFHSDIFIIDGEEVGCMGTSGWGANTIYLLKYGTVNTEATSFVTGTINIKLQ